MNKEFMIIDNIPVAINGEKNLLELIRKAGIELPTFCYYSELSVYGACRMCMVENKWGGMEAACSTPPRNGMEIYTNTPRLRKYRKMILELLLSNHCGECTTCDKNGKCKLQELAARFDIHRVRFDNPKSKPCIDDSSVSITRDANKCILCGDCVRVCNEVQNVGAIDFAFRGSKMKVACSFDKPIGDSNCVGCGQCAAVCPTGAIIIKNDSHRLWKELNQEDTIAVAQVAPAVRVAVAKEFGYNGENVMGKIVAALRRIGFNYIFDTSTAADLTVMEESKEFADRLANGGKLPLFTSCCPAWSVMAKKLFPTLAPYISMALTPMVLTARMLKKDDPDACIAFIGPCAAKKLEASRRTIRSDVDFVLTFEELMGMFNAKGVTFEDITDEEKVDLCEGTGDGRGFAVSGGVAKAVADVIHKLDPEREVKVVSAQGLKDCRKLLTLAKAGKYDGYLLEGMACPGGCVAGAGTLQAVEKSTALVNKYVKNAPVQNSLDSKYEINLDLITEPHDDK